MNKPYFKKDKISIQNIGKQRFWFGVIAGLISAFTLSLIFNRMRETIRFISGVSVDLVILKEDEFLFFNYFFAALASSLGFSITIWVWMRSKIYQRKKYKRYKEQAKTQALFFFWTILFLTAQLSYLLLFVALAGVSSFDLPIDLYQDHWLLFVLTPLVIFLQNWFSVRLIYKSGLWIFYSLCISAILTFILYYTTTVNQNEINSIYFKNNKNAYEYIEKETQKAKKNYRIEFSENTIEILKQWNTNSATEQVRSLQQDFNKKESVNLKTILLEKISIHNYKYYNKYRYYNERNPFINWPYAFPKDILNQLNYFDINSNETKELFEILKELIILANKSKLEVKTPESTSYFNREKYNSEYKVNIEVIKELKEVCDSLKKIKKYAHLSKTLPEVKLNKTQ
ncbi:hypothetical protein ACSIGC_09460 [Tenacibaculum sp. ZS6-P6]|uniref:hypothetical protein n=1 Tax=Tenacibaculum sp. ZS6-P6 TaxID=3447503 RepID=UPI003F992FD5